MDCREFKRSVGEYPDREVRPESRMALERHAAGCPACAAALAVFRAMREGLGGLPRLATSATFEERLERRLALERRSPERRAFLVPAWAPTAGLALAAALVIAIVGFLLASRGPASRGVEEIAIETAGPAAESGGAPGSEPVGIAAPGPAGGSGGDGRSHDMPPEGAGALPAASNPGLDRLLGDGVPLAPPGAERRFVLDGPSDLPGLMREGVEGEVASSPITF